MVFVVLNYLSLDLLQVSELERDKIEGVLDNQLTFVLFQDGKRKFLRASIHILAST